GHLPLAEARRHRGHGDGHEGGRLHRAPLRVLDARLPPVLHQPREGLPAEGLRTAGGVADGQGARAREHPPAAGPRGGASRARDDTELLVVTENGYGKRTAISDYPVKGRGTMGVKTIQLTEKKGALAGALIVREHHELLFISQNGMVQRTSVSGISRYGRASQ